MITDASIESLRFAPGKLNAAMQTIWERVLNEPQGDSRMALTLDLGQPV